MEKFKSGMTLVPSANSPSVRQCQWENVLPTTHEVDGSRTVILELESFQRLAERAGAIRERLARTEGKSDRGGSARRAVDPGAESPSSPVCREDSRPEEEG